MTITLCPLLNSWEIKRLLTIDNLYRDCYFTDDLYSESVILPAQLWFGIYKEQQCIGILLMKEFSNYCVCLHGGLFKEYRHKNTMSIIKQILTFTKSLGLVPVITIPSKSIGIQRVMTKLGFTQSMTLKNGCLNDDLVIFGEVSYA